MRLGVAGALVDGAILVGDVDLDAHGTIVRVGIGSGVGTLLAVPGLVDLQVNGVAGVDLRIAERDGYRTVAAALARHGATAVQPTFHSQSLAAHLDSLRRLGEVLADPPPGCRILAAHLEGPFLAPGRRGAHDRQHLLAPDAAVLRRLLAAGPVGMMTLAPELDGACELIRELIRSGIVASIGHTDATAQQVHTAVAAGARHVTHVWNAQRPITARDPGPVGVALSEPLLTVGLIADLVHVSAEVVALTAAAAAGRLAATTDSVAFVEDPPDRTGGGAPETSGGSPAGGSPAGGTLTGGFAMPDVCLRNLVSVGLSLPAAVDACGGAQRRLLGMPAVRLVPGERAELVVLSGDLRPVRTVTGTDVFEPA